MATATLRFIRAEPALWAGAATALVFLLLGKGWIRFQRAINISLGSSMATIGLTVPVILVIGYVTGRPVELGLDAVDLVILVVTLATIIVNTSTGRTNVLQGVVHILLFVAYLILLFD